MWFTSEIKSEIGLRRCYNRNKRNAENEAEKILYEQQYQEQKKKAQKMIREAIETYERQVAKEIRENGGELWKNINKLRRKPISMKKARIYDENNVEMKDIDAMEAIKEYWCTIYHKHRNNICEVWNDLKREEYAKELIERRKVKVEFDMLVPQELRRAYEFVDGVMERTGRQKDDKYKTRESEVRYMYVPFDLIEHYEMMALNNLRNETRFEMEETFFTTEEVKKQLKMVKGKKKAGPNNMKPEIYKWIMDNRACLDIFTGCLNKVVREGRPPNQWKKSNTILIAKKDKPSKSDFRPLAMTNVTYKIFMSLVKEKIVKHLERNEKMSEFQAGFTKGRRIEDNLMILRYCISESYSIKRPLYVAAIDYSKAFDSVKRESIIMTMKKYKCDARIIEIVAKLYTEDSTNLIINDNKVGEVTVKSGIRQGCTLSPLLFIMVLNHIIDEIVNAKAGFRNDTVYVPTLFFADDGLLLSQNQRELEKMLAILIKVSGEVGLSINQKKCCIMIFNEKNKPVSIQGIEVVSEMKYLGITINDSQNCFKKHKEKKLNTARKMANLTYSVIARSCDKMTIGKAYWKSIVIPTLLYGTATLDWTESEIQELQKVENQVWRSILKAPNYTPCAVLRGEIGSSCMESRIIKTKLKYLNWVLRTRGGLVRTIMEDMIETGCDRMILKMMESMRLLNIASCAKLEKMTSKEIDKIVNESDERKWRRDMEGKSTIDIYRTEKTQIKEERIYENNEASVLLFRARSNTLNLEWRQRYSDGDTSCKICDKNVEENLRHFTEECEALIEVRTRLGLIGRTAEDILLFTGTVDVEQSKAYLFEAWKMRRKIMERNNGNINNNYENINNNDNDEVNSDNDEENNEE